MSLKSGIPGLIFGHVDFRMYGRRRVVIWDSGGARSGGSLDDLLVPPPGYPRNCGNRPKIALKIG